MYVQWSQNRLGYLRPDSLASLETSAGKFKMGSKSKLESQFRTLTIVFAWNGVCRWPWAELSVQGTPHGLLCPVSTHNPCIFSSHCPLHNSQSTQLRLILIIFTYLQRIPASKEAGELFFSNIKCNLNNRQECLIVWINGTVEIVLRVEMNMIPPANVI